MARLRSGNAAPTPVRPAATGRTILREKTNTTTTGTPGPAVETSMLALKNFKRRPRQGSMLEMVRKRRSSVQASLISAQPQQDDGDDVEDTSVFDLGSASEGEDVFAPEAEGTPLQLSKTRKSTSARKSLSAKKSVATTPAVKRTKRKSDEMESPHSALDALRRKHRKSGAIPAEEEPLPLMEDAQRSVVHDTSDREASPVPNPVTSDVQVINSSPQSTPPTEPSSARKIPGTQEEDFAVPSTEEQERLHTLQQDAPEGEQEEEEEEEDDDHDTLNATMAEPASSSPAGSPIPETQRTDIYADPLTQPSPPPFEPAKTRSKSTKKPTAMSTATLRALLPKRTQRSQTRSKRTEYDISSDDEDEDNDASAFDTAHLDDDEDELGGRIRRQRQKALAPSKSKKAAASKSKSKQSLSARKQPPPAKPKAGSRTKAKTTRTYGRATTTSDKENAGGGGGDEPSSEDEDNDDHHHHAGDTSLSMREVAHSKELEEARRKFAEVDNWDLTFESMSNEDHRSSSQGWR